MLYGVVWGSQRAWHWAYLLGQAIGKCTKSQTTDRFEKAQKTNAAHCQHGQRAPRCLPVGVAVPVNNVSNGS